VPNSSDGRRPIIIAALVSLLLIAGLIGVVWQHRSAARRSLTIGTPGLSVTHEAPGPIPTGQLIAGPGGAPVVWISRPSDGTRELTAVPGGVDMTIVRSDYDEWQAVPVVGWSPSMVVRGVVRFVAGGSDNAIGLGCQAEGGKGQLGFHVHDDGTWTLVYFPPDSGSIQDLDTGSSSVIRPTTKVNSLTIACGMAAQTPGGTKVMAAVNGVTVVNDTIGISPAGWSPTIDACSCDGVDTARFTQIAKYAS
jgi:hypothetical protein